MAPKTALRGRKDRGGARGFKPPGAPQVPAGTSGHPCAACRNTYTGRPAPSSRVPCP
jgi:hypothetical protein